jgi:Protein of unknown function (DUF1579)
MKANPTPFYAAIACASSLLCVGTARSHDTPPAQLDQLSGFLGDGLCTGRMLAAKSPHPTTGKFHGERMLGDLWIVVRYDQDATGADPRPYHVIQYLGYDRKAGRLVDVVLDNSGSSYATGTSSGWQGDVMTFENMDSTGGGKAPFRDVFTRQGGKVVSHAGYWRDQRGQWVKGDEETCRRP